MSDGSAIGAALGMAFALGWEILWALVLGFALSGIVQAVITKGEMSRLLPDNCSRPSPRNKAPGRDTAAALLHPSLSH
jgi:hypothetical protein